LSKLRRAHKTVKSDEFLWRICKYSKCPLIHLPGHPRFTCIQASKKRCRASICLIASLLPPNPSLLLLLLFLRWIIAWAGKCRQRRRRNHDNVPGEQMESDICTRRLRSDIWRAAICCCCLAKQARSRSIRQGPEPRNISWTDNKTAQRFTRTRKWTNSDRCDGRTDSRILKDTDWISPLLKCRILVQRSIFVDNHRQSIYTF